MNKEADKEIKILLVEDDEEDYRIFKTYLDSISRTKFYIQRVFLYEEALEAMMKKEHDIYILDYYLGTKNGIDLLKECKKEGFTGPIIFLTGRKNSDTDLEALSFGAYDYLVKDYINPEVLERSIRYTVSRANLERELLDKKILLNSIIDSSPVGICVTDEDYGFIHWNSQFLNMFHLSEDDMKKKINEILVFEKKKPDIYSSEFETKDVPFMRMVKNEIVNFEGKVSSLDRSLYCKVKFKTISMRNGKNRIYEVFTFINLDEYRQREECLRKTVSRVQNMLEKYADETKDSSILIDLSSLEIDKMEQCIIAEEDREHVEV